MAWGNTSVGSGSLKLAGGGDCPGCGSKGSLCLNGGIAAPGERIVSCHTCNDVRCAVCGNMAVLSGGTYACATKH